MNEHNLHSGALEAAAKELFLEEENTAYVSYPEWDSPENIGKESYIEIARAVVTAYLSALPAQPDTVNSVEELEALPAKTVILDRIGDVSVIAETREFMCHDGESYTLDEVSADLPATVLYRPVEG